MTKTITLEDFEKFKKEMRDYCNRLIANRNLEKPLMYLKSFEVMDLLGISPGTLQNLRINGTLPYTKIGGTIYYEVNQIQKVMEMNRVHKKRKVKSEI